MARHDVYPSPDGRGYLLDVQTDLLGDLNTRLVVPLLPEGDAPRPARVLNPVFEVGGARHVMVTQFLSAVPAVMLKAPVASLSGRADEITRAIDMATHRF